MPAYPYDTLMRYKRWATNGLTATIAANLSRLDARDRVLIVRLLDHIQRVDEMFGDHLEGRPHRRRSPRSFELPEFETLARKAIVTAEWYVSYADLLTRAQRDETVDFTFSDGTPGRMTRGDMLLHVATHGTYHRGNIGILLQKNGIEPHADRLTDFLAAERTLEAA
ncbi:DinB family protein [Sphingomonas sp.]|uniref:DinB family protein n=1 Tax=Sphingomonas sp. TaxID=28214 RepID=UPI002EDA3454